MIERGVATGSSLPCAIRVVNTPVSMVAISVVTADPDRVRVLAVVDWDVGFQLTAHAPLPDVRPGESYVTEFSPQRAVAFHEVLVEGFALVQISVGERTPKATVEELPRLIDRPVPRHLYRLDEALTVGPDAGARLLLCNDSDVPRKQKDVTLVRDVAADWPARRRERPEDTVPCPACDRRPGDSCDGPASHPSRLALYLEHPQ